MSLREWWRKITGGSAAGPDARQPPIDEPPAQTPTLADEGKAPERDLSAEERRTLQDEEIL